MLRRYQFLWAAGVLAVLLVAARVALPYVIEDQANKHLMALPDYDGHVEDVDLALWRGAYRLDGIEIVKTGTKNTTPFFKSDRIDLSLEWRSLFRGSVVASCMLWRPNVNLVQADSRLETQLGQGVDWHRQLEESFPFRFNTIRVTEGTVTFRAPAIRTEDALKATHVNAEITNMTNVADTDIETYAGFKATATVLGNGSAAVAGAANPLEST